jgi:cellulose synthase/poly-beta-1,6-N-acetylglucosamine synthase-like glycosyltransferase
MNWLEWGLCGYMLALNGSQLWLLVLALLETLDRRAMRLPELDNQVLSSASTPPITIIAPAYNEEANIEDSVRAFLQVEYPSLQLVVVNDGSRDGTLQRLKQRFQLRPTGLVVRGDLPARAILALYQSRVDERLLVVDKDNGGKADALNVGINVARSPLICCVDADSVIDRRALLRMVEPYLYSDDRVVAVGGTVLPANGTRIRDGVVEAMATPRSALACFQAVEYLRAFVYARMGLNRAGGNLIVSGAFGLFLREAVVAAGGYRTDTVGEDAELVVRIHRLMRERGERYRVVHIPDPVCLTEVPETLAVLGRQRDRWQRGLLDTLWLHRKMLFHPGYGAVGLLAMPMLLLFELLGPFIELAGYVWFAVTVAGAAVNRPFAVGFFLVAFVWGLMLSAQSLILESLDRPGVRPLRQQLQLLAMAALENFGYRQLTLWFRMRGVWRFVMGEKSWGEMKRRGLQRKEQTP